MTYNELILKIQSFLTLIVILKVMTISGEIDKKTSVNFHPITRV